MLYHGSNVYIEDTLIPHKSFHYEPYVYATSDYFYALVRAGRFNANNLTLKEDYDGLKHTLIELKENAFKEVFDSGGYIYLVDDSNFYTAEKCMPNEYISTKECKIVQKIYIPNLFEEINKCSSIYISLIRYGSKEEKEYWETVRGGKEGYLQRRKERIERLNRS